MPWLQRITWYPIIMQNKLPKKSCLIYLLVTVLMVFTQSSFGLINKINQVRVLKEKSKTCLFFDFSGSLEKYRSFMLQNPTRLVIDIDNVEFGARIPSQLLKNTLVYDIRIGKRNNKQLRIVMDLHPPVSYKILISKKNYGADHSLIIDLFGSKMVKPTTTVTPNYTQAKQPNLKISHEVKAHKMIVVIDPGHGGKDPGAMGPRGSREKNVVLAIAKKLKQTLEKIPGIQAYLTRSGDYYISLRRRLQLARRQKADIFIAIHADAYRNAHSHGASVYALSQRGASSEAARWIAAKENYSELGGVNLSDKGDMLRSVLIDLSQTATIGASLKLGSEVLQRLGKYTLLHNHRIEQARFVVLKSPDIPSILIETGFISNPNEEKRLNNALYQKQLVSAILQGVEKYFAQTMPAPMLVSKPKAKTNHRIARY